MCQVYYRQFKTPQGVLSNMSMGDAWRIPPLRIHRGSTVDNISPAILKREMSSRRTTVRVDRGIAAAVRSKPLSLSVPVFARCSSKAVDTFDGDWEQAADWMTTPNLALGNREPIEVIAETGGDERVIRTLTRIDHGVLG